MSISVQGGGIWKPYGSERPETNDELLRLELSWKTIASSLTQILVSYALVAVCVFLTVGLGLYMVVNTNLEINPTSPKALEISWVYHGGSGIVFLLYLFSYAKLLINNWRCAIHSPDRHGAKWYIFACCLCLVIGPVIGIAGGISINLYGSNAQAADVQALHNFKDFKNFDEVTEASPMAGGILQTAIITYIAGIAISLATLVCFVMFLKAIGHCFQDTSLTFLADVFILFTVALICATIFVFFLADSESLPPIFMIIVPFAWLGTLVWYVVLIVLARSVINRGMDGLVSPLESMTEMSER